MTETTTISVIMSGQCGPLLRHMERAQSAKFYAPSKASIKESRLYPVFILYTCVAFYTPVLSLNKVINEHFSNSFFSV